MTPYETALNCRSLGLSPIPIKPGTKLPAAKEWGPYQQRIASEDELKRFFSNGAQLAVVGGAVSGNLECLDFDKPDLFQPFLDTLEGINAELRRKLRVYQYTPSGGSHLLYRCSDIVSGNTKLAMGPRYLDEHGKPRQDVFIETRGQGGYFLISPSKGYKLHGSLNKIPVITPEERELLLALARSFDEAGKTVDQQVPVLAAPANGDRPGDIFNRDQDWRQLLESEGWTHAKTIGDREHWTRPGKQDGSTSATLNAQGLFCFSSSTSLPTQKPLSKFAFYAYYRHNGDFTAAAQSLKSSGQFRTTPDSSGQFQMPPDAPRMSPGNAPDKERVLAQEVLAFIEADPAPFYNNDLYSELCARDRREKRTICDALYYYEKQRKIRRIEGKRGHWEVVEGEPEVMDLLSARAEPFNILLPLDISNSVRVRRGSVILISGSNNAGKTLFLLSIVRNFVVSPAYVQPALPLSNKLERKGLPPLVYLNSEMSKEELVARIKGFGDDPALWVPHVKFIERTHSFDKLVSPDGVTFVDYLEVNEDFFNAGKFLADIHRRLKDGIAVVAMQKKQGQAFAKGGEMTLEKPRLAINLDKNEPHGFICKITKAKEPVDFMHTIQGMERDYVITGKSEILPISNWRFVSETQRKAINQEYARNGLPDRVKRERLNYKTLVPIEDAPVYIEEGAL